MAIIASGSSIPLNEPLIHEEAMSRTDKAVWVTAIKEEIIAIEQNAVWTLESLPTGTRIIAKKVGHSYQAQGQCVSCLYDVHLVVKRCSQRSGTDFEDIYASVIKYSTLCLVLAIVQLRGLKIV